MDEKPKANVVTPGASALVPLPQSGRTYTGHRRVSIDDAAPSGRMELDAIARFLQDVGNDDTDDAGMAELGLAWVARRARIDVTAEAHARELLTMQTWCSGTGRRWAERRTTIRGENGAHIDAAAVWVHLDATTGRPTPWGEGFERTYMEATCGRQVDAKLRHEKTPPARPSVDWRFRRTDMDAFGHVNNAAYLAIAEEFFELDENGSYRIEIEWRGPSQADEVLSVTRATNDEGNEQLWVTASANQDSGATDLRVTMTKSSIDVVIAEPSIKG